MYQLLPRYKSDNTTTLSQHIACHFSGMVTSADGELKHDILAGQLLVDRAKGVKLVLCRVAVLGVQVHLSPQSISFGLMKIGAQQTIFQSSATSTPYTLCVRQPDVEILANTPLLPKIN